MKCCLLSMSIKYIQKSNKFKTRDANIQVILLAKIKHIETFLNPFKH